MTLPRTANERGRLLAHLVQRTASNPRRPLGDPNQRIQTRCLEGLEPTFRLLVGKVVPLALDGRFCVILGEDTSGRVPTLVMREVLNSALRAHGRDSLPTLFWPVSEKRRDVVQHALTELRPVKVELARALVVTDWINTGTHAARLGTELRAIDICADIATLGVSEFRPVTDPIERVHYGQWQDPFDYWSYQSDKVNGLNKNTAISGLHRGQEALKLTRPDDPQNERTTAVVTDRMTRKAMAIARRDVQTIAARIVRDLSLG